MLVPSVKDHKHHDNLNFDHEKTAKILNAGRADAIEILKEKPGARFDKLRKKHHKKE